MNKMDMSAIRTTFNGVRRCLTSPNFNDVTKFGQEMSSATSRARRERLCCFHPLEEKIVNKSCFQSIFQVQTAFTPVLRLNKHDEVLKIT